MLDQSADCVKLVSMAGTVQYMNANGLAAMQTDDFGAVCGRPWEAMWPETSRAVIREAYAIATDGLPARFRAFCPTLRGEPRWWDVAVTKVADTVGRQVGFLVISRDVTDDERTREALSIAASEMRHRLKNTYMMIGSLLNGFARGNLEHQAFAADMSDRLGALSTAQSLFVADDAPCNIRMLIPALMVPFATPGCPIKLEDQPDVALAQSQANAVALVLGELSVNSAKHGAIAHGGTIKLRTEVADGQLLIEWTERSARAVVRQERPGGQGLRLIERIVSARKGSITCEWQDDGLHVRLTFTIL